MYCRNKILVSMMKIFVYFLLGIHLCQSVFHIRKQWDGGFFGGILI